jgi:hypothetical protein
VANPTYQQHGNPASNPPRENTSHPAPQHRSSPPPQQHKSSPPPKQSAPKQEHHKGR